MSFCLFVVFREDASVNENAIVKIAGLQKAHVYTPQSAHDPFLKDGPPPPLALQLYFRTLQELESADYSALKGHASCQAMRVHRFANEAVKQPFCTYLVAYEGPAEDPAAWHAHYLAHHPPLMAKLPGVRELEIYTPLQWQIRSEWKPVNCLQRNKVAFDDAEALTAALNSPIRQEMRADYGRFPRFGGAVSHYPMLTRVILGPCS